MRTPSTHAELYAYHEAALRGERPEVIEEEPQCGFYRMRMVQGGPWVAVRIYCIQELDDNGDLAEPERLHCSIGGEFSVRLPWPRCAHKPITQDAYRELLHMKDDETMAATHVAVDLSERATRP